MDDVSKFGMHSIKSGAASNPAYGRIPGDLLDIHAGGSVLPITKCRFLEFSRKFFHVP